MARLEIPEGPDASVVIANAKAAVEAYVASAHLLGRVIPRSGLMAALHQPEVLRVTLLSPIADIEAAATEAAYCTAVTVTRAI